MPHNLVIGDGNKTITAEMYCLLPRPVTAIGIMLYLLTLVDFRYFWSDLSTDEIEIDEESTLGIDP